GDKKLCMKWISVQGCSGNGHGGCFDSKRAHFRPKELPDIVKAHIIEKFKGHFRPKELPDIVKAHIIEKFKGLAADLKEG
ncbi:hypothetical protein PHMEG_00037490, partial [Phytophthora megakarya]